MSRWSDAEHSASVNFFSMAKFALRCTSKEVELYSGEDWRPSSFRRANQPRSAASVGALDEKRVVNQPGRTRSRMQKETRVCTLTLAR
jgi:hypothetical protein